MAIRVWWLAPALAVLFLGACEKKGEEPKAEAETSAPPAPAPAPAPASDAAAAPASDAAAAPAPAPAPAAAAAADFKVGDTVYGKWTDDQWYPGKIAAINPDGTFRVNYNDGDVSKKLPRSRVKARKSSGGKSSAGSGGCSGGKTKCGGRCVDLYNDPKNCNACGRECPEACQGGSCVSNAYKYGN